MCADQHAILHIILGLVESTGDAERKNEANPGFAQLVAPLFNAAFVSRNDENVIIFRRGVKWPTGV